MQVVPCLWHLQPGPWAVLVYVSMLTLLLPHLLLVLDLCVFAVVVEHAELQQKGKQVFLKALQGESVFDRWAVQQLLLGMAAEFAFDNVALGSGKHCCPMGKQLAGWDDPLIAFIDTCSLTASAQQVPGVDMYDTAPGRLMHGADASRIARQALCAAGQTSRRALQDLHMDRRGRGSAQRELCAGVGLKAGFW